MTSFDRLELALLRLQVHSQTATRLTAKYDIILLNLILESIKKQMMKTKTWVSVKTRLPEEHNREVLVFTPKNLCQWIAVYDGKRWTEFHSAKDFIHGEISHWRTVPSNPTNY